MHGAVDVKYGVLLEPAVFLSRENRYLALVEREGLVVPAHVPNSGLMSELLLPGRPVRIAPAGHPGRKTAYDVILVEHEGRWVSVDSRLPPRLVQEALATGILRLEGFPTELRREVAHGGSRFDMAARSPAAPAPQGWGEQAAAPPAPQPWGEQASEGSLFVVEAKSVNLVEAGRAFFPDVPTARGARHCRHLAELVSRGGHGALVFVIQREDADLFSPHAAVDPDFARALAEARAAGVLVRALRCRVDETAIVPVGEIPVELR